MRRAIEATRSPPNASRRGLQRLVEVSEDVVDVLEADREAHVVLRHAGRELLFGPELRVGGRRRMNRERARVADVGDVIEKLQRVDETFAGFDAALQLKPTRPPYPPFR